jgi:hypothetical protein
VRKLLKEFGSSTLVRQATEEELAKMSMRRASPEDISSTGLSARCEASRSASTCFALASMSFETWWLGQIPMLEKKPETTISKPVISRVH